MNHRNSFLRAKPLLLCDLRALRPSWPRCDPLSPFLDLGTSANTHRDLGSGLFGRVLFGAASAGWPERLPIATSPRITLTTLVETRAPRAAAAGGGDNGGGTTAGTEAATRPRRRGGSAGRCRRPAIEHGGRPRARDNRRRSGSRASPACRRCTGRESGWRHAASRVAETLRTELEAGSWMSTAGTETLSAATSLQPPPGGGGHRKTRDAGDGVAVR